MFLTDLQSALKSLREINELFDFGMHNFIDFTEFLSSKSFKFSIAKIRDLMLEIA